MDGFISIKLPSQGLIYNDFDPEAVKIRLLKGKDEKLIAELNANNFDRKLNTILRNLLQGIDPNKLTLGDRKYLLIWLAINSYTKMFPVELTCEHCFQDLTIETDLSEIENKLLPDDFKQPYKVTLSSGDVYLKLLTVEDELKVADYELAGNNGYLHRLALSIVDQEKDLGAKVKIIEEMPGFDLARIKAFHAKFDHGPVMESEYTCKHCGGLGHVAVPFRIEMVFPVGEALTKYYGQELWSDLLYEDSTFRDW